MNSSPILICLPVAQIGFSDKHAIIGRFSLFSERERY